MTDIVTPIAFLGMLVIAHPGAASVAYSGVLMLDTLKSRDYVHGGSGRITGTVEEKGAPNSPLHRKVRLHRETDGLMVRETWSDKNTGEFVFTDIALEWKYTALAYDYNHNYTAVTADNLIPEEMA